tara:strand:+ start:154 stop:330 length:177 start_codon:yes stop_codon:yes gene_type:complete
MTDEKFIDEVYEIAFGDNARYRLTGENAYKHEEVIETLREFEQWSLKWEEHKGIGCFE